MSPPANYRHLSSVEKITYSMRIHASVEKLKSSASLSPAELDELEGYYTDCLECMLIKPEDFGQMVINGYKRKIALIQGMKATIRAAS